MSIKVEKYIDLPKRYEKYGDEGYFIPPHIIQKILFDKLKLSDAEQFVNEASITITEDEIKEFLDKSKNKKESDLKQKLEKQLEILKHSCYDEKEVCKLVDCMTTTDKYSFEPYSLQYFKTYTFILKEKCQTLFSVLNDINRCKSEKLSEEANQRLLDLDFHINSKGNIHFKDAERLADAIIYNVKDLKEKIKVGNNPKTYLTFKLSKHILMKNDVWESEIYPSRKIQIKDRYHARMKQFIALSETQEMQVQEEELENFSKWMEWTWKEDSDEKEKVPCYKN